MNKLYTYVMTHDAGLAPNPFGGICTLAVCTPNHQGSRAERGDWIAGVSDKQRGYQLIYVMEVDERIHMNDYYHDRRFAMKKPVLDGTAQQRCGDNFYSSDALGQWTQHPTVHHDDAYNVAQDTQHPWVFVGRRFWYLGREAVDLPREFRSMFGGRGARVDHPVELVASFRDWVQESLKEGMNALPRDLEGDGSCPPSDAPTAYTGHPARTDQASSDPPARRGCGS